MIRICACIAYIIPYLRSSSIFVYRTNYTCLLVEKMLDCCSSRCPAASRDLLLLLQWLRWTCSTVALQAVKPVFDGACPDLAAVF